MTRKIIIDCDPGIDDAVAICIALFDPRVEVLAITPTAGTTEAAQSTKNVEAIVSQLIRLYTHGSAKRAQLKMHRWPTATTFMEPMGSVAVILNRWVGNTEHQVTR